MVKVYSEHQYKKSIVRWFTLKELWLMNFGLTILLFKIQLGHNAMLIGSETTCSKILQITTVVKSVFKECIFLLYSRLITNHWHTQCRKLQKRKHNKTTLKIEEKLGTFLILILLQQVCELISRQKHWIKFQKIWLSYV